MKKPTSLIQKLMAFAAIVTMLAPAMIVRADAGAANKPLTENQKIVHVLNRLGFGARPGDVEKVKAMGLQKYIDQQMNPSSIDDSVAEGKVKNLDIFNMSTAELFAKYPNPGALLRQLAGGKKAQANAQNQNKAAATPNGAAPQDPPRMTQPDQKIAREKIP